MLGRRTATGSDKPANRSPEAPPAKPGGKGRPTPKRREAEGKARQPLSRDPKVRARQQRQRAREDRVSQRQAMLSGDESRLPVRDRGPVRRYVRDWVDVRTSVLEFFMPVVVLLYIAMIVAGGSSTTAAVYSQLALYAFILGVIVDGVITTIRLRRAVRERFAGDPRYPTRGVVLYGLIRSSQFRKIRLPRPMVRRGGTPRSSTGS